MGSNLTEATTGEPADRVFAALADPHRRTLLDRLRRRDDQTLTDLCDRMPMSRQAVTKHLRVLGDAGLVRVRREGRTSVHSLDAAPLHDVSAWLWAYADLMDAALNRLRTYLEENP
jgi:DNA-binding transcriptional ArsR family regulator